MAVISSGIKSYNLTENPSLAEVNRKEVLRYAGARQSDISEDSSFLSAMESCIKEAMPKLSYKLSYRRETLEWEDDKPLLPFDIGDSKAIVKNLQGCTEIIIFAATIGIEIDRLIARYGRLSPPKALFMQAFGAERIEALCDLFNNEVKEMLKSEGKSCRPRFSPGYGDLPLSAQRDIIDLLDCTRRIGISLNESCLMSPSKSVTAVIGIYDSDEKTESKNKCESCCKTDCAYREV